MKVSICTATLLSILNLAIAGEGPGHSSGGGFAWVCRNKDFKSSIRWARVMDAYEIARLYDRVEATSANGTVESRTDSPDGYSGSVGHYLDFAMGRLNTPSSENERSLYAEISFHVYHERKENVFQPNYSAPFMRPNADKIQYLNNLNLFDPKDDVGSVIPKSSECKDGFFRNERPELVILYIDKEAIFISEQLYHGVRDDGIPVLSNFDKAVLEMHEAVYAVRRRIFGDTDSQHTRGIVSRLFSDPK